MALAILVGWAYKWRNDYAMEQVQKAGTEATAQAYVERDEFQRKLDEAISSVQKKTEQRLEAVESRYANFEDLLRADWDEDLQNSDDFVARANAATERVYERRWQRLQEIFAQ